MERRWEVRKGIKEESAWREGWKEGVQWSERKEEKEEGGSRVYWRGREVKRSEKREGMSL